MNVIKKILPRFLFNLLYNFRFIFKLSIVTVIDFLNFNAFSFAKKGNNSKSNVLARITLYYHSIEKGLSHKTPRLGFGCQVVLKLMKEIEVYNKLKFSPNDTRYLSGLAVVKKYFDYHSEERFDLGDIYSEYKGNIVKLVEAIEGIDEFGGAIEVDPVNYFLDYEDFSRFAKSRVSVRKFNNSPLDYTDLQKAVLVSQKSPSACNRQPSKVYHITKSELISEVLSLQSGFRSWGDNLSNLLLITSDMSFYGSINERKANLIDGGLFGMSLIFSLRTLGYQTCVLNSTMSNRNTKKVKKLLSISKSESLIFFLAVGKNDEIVKVPLSYRDNPNDIIKTI